MKTTVDIPDALLRKVKARAALDGQPMKVFVVQALQDRLHAPAGPQAHPPQPAWMKLFGAFKNERQAIRDIQGVIDQEFSRINPEDWR